MSYNIFNGSRDTHREKKHTTHAQTHLYLHIYRDTNDLAVNQHVWITLMCVGWIKGNLKKANKQQFPCVLNLLKQKQAHILYSFNNNIKWLCYFSLSWVNGATETWHSWVRHCRWARVWFNMNELICARWLLDRWTEMNKERVWEIQRDKERERKVELHSSADRYKKRLNREKKVKWREMGNKWMNKTIEKVNIKKSQTMCGNERRAVSQKNEFTLCFYEHTIKE